MESCISRLPITLAVAFAASVSYAQSDLAGKGQFPQVRAHSGLSGSSIAISPAGVPGVKGALTLSSPIGYTLGSGRAVMFGGATSSDGAFRGFDGKTKVNRSNGSAGLILGLPLGEGSMAISVMQTSRLPEDKIINLQISPFRRNGRMGISLGAQDLFDKTVTTPDYHEKAQSFFVAATYDAGKGVFVTAGSGTTRFRRGFGSVSAAVARGARAMVEHDGYGWNWGASVDLGSLRFGGGTPAQASMFLGVTQGKYVTWSVGVKG